jgi:hypothetical protein
MSKLETHSYKKFWPMKQLEGVNADGSKRSTKGFRDMITGEFYVPNDGWNGEPPELPSGEKLPNTSSGKYREHYEATFGHG